MNKIKFLLCVISLATLLSCNSIDFSNPEEVIKSYRTLSKENKNEKLYDDFLSAKSKEFVTKDEFVKSRSKPDSILNSTSLLESKVSSYPIDVNNPTYRRFKVDEKMIFKKDTIFKRLYYSLINENGKWKVVWTGTLLSFVDKKFDDGNYLEARKTLEKIIEIDPFNGLAYKNLAWCYLRDQTLTKNDWENGVVKNAKYAVALEEDNYLHYNTLAAYYSRIGNSDLAIQNYERGLTHCLNNKEKDLFYYNLSLEYLVLKKYEKAEEYILKSIKPGWYLHGQIKQAQGNYLEAFECFEKSLKEGMTEKSLQGDLFYDYSHCCLNLGKCELALEYINKALDIQPNDEYYQDLYKQIKDCHAKTQ